MEALIVQFFAVWLPPAIPVSQKGVIADKAAAPQAAAASTTSSKAARSDPTVLGRTFPGAIKLGSLRQGKMVRPKE
ncbi:hypothetical protein B0A54_08146 [Friedmanniomyces endolithicus]|uniref:Uncharacterized protein n=1 Tax=Friedmanniomyces endolithicus TaxID=329885 RepID=A0A4U0UZL4_9PEZI|nr:hypothetical protein B0A54_08146 [Friedmanniomyces endolithicus]